MKIKVLALIICAAVFTAGCGCGKKEKKEKKSLVKKVVTSVTSTATSAVKDTASGIVEGIDEGRKDGDSIDGAIVVSDKKGLEKYLDLKVLSVTKYTEKAPSAGTQNYLITIALKNEEEESVRMTGLSSAKSIVLLDKDGFSSTLPSPAVQGKDVTVLPDSSSKARYYFLNVEGEPSVLRIYGKDIKLPAVSQ
ncbi:hypothetical protein Dip518_001253 [Parelusimicrobium proximum]|uniref:hypothetical protein n=1 Tax=Parelusimicrobium proximum TaxID=3228953 RepID=UPI003D170A60